jgi:hypothetical protein
MPHVVDSDDDAPPPRAAWCRACGHDHAPGTTCGVCGHHRRVDDDLDDLPRPRLGHDEPIIEVIDKFLCLGAFEHTSKEDVLLACGIRTVMNVRGERTNAAGEQARAREERRRDGRSGEGRGTWGGRALAWRSAERREWRRARMAGTRSIGARRRFGDDEGSVDAIGGQKSAVTDERRDARERTERAAVHAVL